MNVKMTTGEKLKDLRVERHLKLEDLSQEVHIAASTLSNYENDENYDVSAANIKTLADFYNVSTDYLLGMTENRNGSRKKIEAIHLDDKVLDILSSGRINNRLLCELIKAPGFKKLMADIEIYVDGIAQMQINNLNSYVNVVRNEIITKYNPPKDDAQLNVLEAATIDEDDYFADRIHQDIDQIVRMIRSDHEQDQTSMPVSSAVHEIHDSLKAANDFKGSHDEKLVAFFCKQLGINYHSLSPEQFQTLISILKKSSLLKSGISSRGKKKTKKQ